MLNACGIPTVVIQCFGDIEDIGFEFNHYNSCVDKLIVNKKQHIIWLHVDNLLSANIDSKVNDLFLKWLKIL